MQAGAQAGRGKQREKTEDTRRAEGRESGCGFSHRSEISRLSGRQAGRQVRAQSGDGNPAATGKSDRQDRCCDQ